MKMTLKDIREEYEKNYNEICHVIEQMGGDGFINLHKRHNTKLYKRLRELQKKEHYLDYLENQLRQNPAYARKVLKNAEERLHY
jgi:hypothetical protein